MLRAPLLAVLLSLAMAAPAGAIVGGRPATEPYPFAGSLEYRGDHSCGASLLSPEHVLTAAHCVEREQASDFTVVLGRHDLDTTAGEVHEVESISVHPAYATDRAGGHDVAVLTLSTRSALAPLPLAGPGDEALWAPGMPSRVIGWGSSFYLLGPSPDDLHEVDVPMVSDASCGRYDATLVYEFDAETMVCAGEDEGFRDSCQGDSGGPLVVRGPNGWLQVGTVSFGLGCGFPLFYGVYGRVADDPLRAWILGQAGPAAVPPPGAPGPGGQGAAGPPAAPASPAAGEPRARVRVKRRLGSARKARRRGALKVRLRTTRPLTGVTVELRRGGRLLARGRRPSLERRGAVRIPVRRVRAGRMRAVVRATDAAGRRVRAAARVRVRR